MTRRGRWVLACFLAVLLAGFGLLFPTGALLRQSSELSSANHALATLKAQNASLASQARALNSTAYISFLAHKDYGLVTPGQEAYVILPTPKR